MFQLLPHSGFIYMTAAIPVQDPSTGTTATAQSLGALRRNVVLTEAACQENSGYEHGDPINARCPDGFNAPDMIAPCV